MFNSQALAFSNSNSSAVGFGLRKSVEHFDQYAKSKEKGLLSGSTHNDLTQNSVATIGQPSTFVAKPSLHKNQDQSQNDG